MSKIEETSESRSFSKGLCLRDTKEVILDLKCQAGADGLCSVGSREPWKKTVHLKRTGFLSHDTGYFPREPV